MKLTGNGQTWYLRSRLVDYFDESFGDPRPVYLPDRYQNYYMADDDCDLTQGVQGSGTSNLCGGLTSANPCSLFGERIDPWEWPYEPYIYSPYTSPIGYRQSVRWQVSDDCSEVTLTLYYTVRTGASVPFTFTTYRYTTTLATQWIGSGLPVVFDTEFGDLTLAECGASEPPPPLYVICCWKAAITTPSGTDNYVSKRAADIAICIEGQPRDDGQITEQCSSEILIDYVAETEANATGVANYSLSYVPAIIRYEVSPDYSYVRISIEADSDDGLYHWESVEVDVPFTSDWFLTPIVVEATSAETGLDPADASLTLGPCDHIDPGETCMPECMIHRYSIGGVDYINYRPLYMAVDSFQVPQPCCNDPQYEEVPLFYFWNGTGDPEDPIINPGDAYEGYYIEMFQAGSCAGLRVWIWCEIGSTQLQIKVIAHHPGSFTVPSFTTTLTENITLECDEDGEVSNEGSEVSINKPWCNETGHSEAQHYIRILIYSQNAGLP